jgi:Short-chain dehydrogenases of various substrate specificities
MKALVTGASSGIGREIAIYLSELGIDLVLVAKDKEKLETIKDEITANIKIKLIVIDLADEKRIKELYMVAKNENIDILINNAGFGLFGDYENTDLLSELEMIDVNVKAVHILTRMFLKDMVKKDLGYILNVASSAGLLKGGPLMSTYYATKSYVTNFSLAIYEELRRKKSNVKISILCPGPVRTNFNNVAGVKFDLRSLDAKDVARYAIDKMFKDKLLIVPGFSTKLGLFLTRFLSVKRILKITYNIQRKKG